ncbi:MAG: hypothetical protein RIC38_05775, partial [Chromatocurvus sp.]
MAISEADFEQLSQLLDGELEAAERHHLEQRIALEPELAATWQRLQAINAGLQLAYAGNDSAGVPGAIRALLKNEKNARNAEDNVVPLFRRQTLWPAALAASLVLAVAVALSPNNGPTTSQQPGMTLATVLDSAPSDDTWHDLDDGRQLRAVLTFPNHDGGWCREFLLRDAGQAG